MVRVCTSGAELCAPPQNVSYIAVQQITNDRTTLADLAASETRDVSRTLDSVMAMRLPWPCQSVEP